MGATRNMLADFFSVTVAGCSQEDSVPTAQAEAVLNTMIRALVALGAATCMLISPLARAVEAENEVQAYIAEMDARALLRQRFENLLVVMPARLPVTLQFDRSRSVPFRLTWGQVKITPSVLEREESPQMFGLAHELAHWQLCHLHYTIKVSTELRARGFKKPSASYFEARRSLERQADQLAFQTLALLGRDALGDAMALFRMTDYLSESAESHPSDQERIGTMLRTAALAWMNAPNGVSRFVHPDAYAPDPALVSYCELTLPEGQLLAE